MSDSKPSLNNGTPVSPSTSTNLALHRHSISSSSATEIHPADAPPPPLASVEADPAALPSASRPPKHSNTNKHPMACTRPSNVALSHTLSPTTDVLVRRPTVKISADLDALWPGDLSPSLKTANVPPPPKCSSKPVEISVDIDALWHGDLSPSSKTAQALPSPKGSSKPKAQVSNNSGNPLPQKFRFPLLQRKPLTSILGLPPTSSKHSSTTSRGYHRYNVDHRSSQINPNCDNPPIQRIKRPNIFAAPNFPWVDQVAETPPISTTIPARWWPPRQQTTTSDPVQCLLPLVLNLLLNYLGGLPPIE